MLRAVWVDKKRRGARNGLTETDVELISKTNNVHSISFFLVRFHNKVIVTCWTALYARGSAVWLTCIGVTVASGGVYHWLGVGPFAWLMSGSGKAVIRNFLSSRSRDCAGYDRWRRTGMYWLLWKDFVGSRGCIIFGYRWIEDNFFQTGPGRNHMSSHGRVCFQSQQTF